MNAIVPIEPFKLFYNIQNGVRRAQLEARTEAVSTTVGASSSGRSSQAGGLSQLGYACFWPNGGGLQEQQNDYAPPAQNTEDIQGDDDDDDDDDQ